MKTYNILSETRSSLYKSLPKKTQQLTAQRHMGMPYPQRTVFWGMVEVEPFLRHGQVQLQRDLDVSAKPFSSQAWKVEWFQMLRRMENGGNGSPFMETPQRTLHTSHVSVSKNFPHKPTPRMHVWEGAMVISASSKTQLRPGSNMRGSSSYFPFSVPLSVNNPNLRIILGLYRDKGKENTKLYTGSPG